MRWTQGRIEAATALIAQAGTNRGWINHLPPGSDVLTLARIGLAVVEASPETVERVEDALRSVLLSPDTPGPNIEIKTREEALAVMECINAAACAVVAALANEAVETGKSG